MQEWTDRNPAADLHNLLAPVKKEPMKALPLKDLPSYLQRLDSDNRELHVVTRAALKLMVMLFVRTRELIEAKWEELDLGNVLWRIPAERMPPITSRFLFVDVSARRAKQLRRGALPRLEALRPDPETGERSESTSRMERVAMQEVEQGLVVYKLLDETDSAETTS